MAEKTDYKKLLVSLGFKEDQLPAAEVDAINYDEVATGLLTGMENRFKNDAGFLKPIQDAARVNAIQETQRKIVKTFGLTFENPEDAQNLDKVITKAHGEIKAQSGKSAQEWQDKLIQKDKEKESLVEEYEKKLETEKGNSQNIERTYKLNDFLSKEIGKLNDTTKKVKLKSSVEVNLPFFKQQLEENYTIKYDGGNFQLRQKANPDLEVTEGTKKLGFSDVIHKIATEKDLLQSLEEKKKKFTFVKGKDDLSDGEADSEGMRKIRERTGQA